MRDHKKSPQKTVSLPYLVGNQELTPKALVPNYPHSKECMFPVVVAGMFSDSGRNVTLSVLYSWHLIHDVFATFQVKCPRHTFLQCHGHQLTLCERPFLR